MRRLLAGLLGAVALSMTTTPAATAFESSAAHVVSRLSLEDSARFSKQVERDLAAKGARIAIVCRTGRPRDKLPEGISYTHCAFWAYRTITTEDGRTLQGYAVYNLYHGDGEKLAKSKSYLHQDWPLDFVRGSAVDDVAIIVPSPEMQRRMIAVLDGESYARLHNDSYSLVANPLERKYQNCNGLILYVIAAATWDTDDAAQLQANLQAYFKPSPVNVAGYQRVFGPIMDGRLKTDDQGRAIVTTTYESLSAFMTEYGLLTASYSVERER